MTKYSKKKKKKKKKILQVRTSQKASQKKPKTQNIVVLSIYNINYWDKDGSKIIENIKKVL